MDPDQERIISKLVARAWGDNEFRRRFVADPIGVLREAGVVFVGIAVLVVVLGTGQEAAAATLKQELESQLESQEAVVEIVLPPKPKELNEENLSDSETVIAFFKRVCAC